MHDTDEQSATVRALEPLIQALQEMDAGILPIDEDTMAIQYVQVYESADDAD
jgi:DNA-directed RNA polymerase subunit K/omega